MITEDYVSFETAKLLKEKGFPQYKKEYGFVGLKYNVNGELTTAPYAEHYAAPALQMAMKWLRKVHKLHIEIVLNQYIKDEEVVIENYYHFNVSRLNRFVNEGGDCKFYNSSEQACEAAIKYCLENLI